MRRHWPRTASSSPRPPPRSATSQAGPGPSADRFASWIAGHQADPATSRAVAQVRELIGDRLAGPDRVVTTLLGWLASDQKVTPLKTLQGLIWERGFATGELIAHFYPDAIPALRAWKAADHGLYIFSSGSAAAQRAWFGHSPQGDLRPLISGYFDTENAGPNSSPAPTGPLRRRPEQTPRGSSSSPTSPPSSTRRGRQAYRQSPAARRKALPRSCQQPPRSKLTRPAGSHRRPAAALGGH